jgi:serine/threonine protein kinase
VQVSWFRPGIPFSCLTYSRRNILVHTDGPVKIADFGLSAVATDDVQASHLAVRWTAPEALLSGKHAEKSDVFSFGATSWETFELGRAPWHWIRTNKEVTNAVISGQILPRPDLCPESVYDVLVKCWEPDPEERIGFDAVRHEIEAARGRLLEDSSRNSTPTLADPYHTSEIAGTYHNRQQGAASVGAGEYHNVNDGDDSGSGAMYHNRQEDETSVGVGKYHNVQGGADTEDTGAYHNRQQNEALEGGDTGAYHNRQQNEAPIDAGRYHNLQQGDGAEDAGVYHNQRPEENYHNRT